MVSYQSLRAVALIAFALLLQLHSFAGASEGDRVRLSLYSSEDTLREQVLHHTPVGSPATEVLEFVNERLVHDGVIPPPYGQSKGVEVPLPFHQSSPLQRYRQVGVHSIKVHLGTYRTPDTLFLFRASVWIDWAFDESDRLLDVFVAKYGEPP
jgi:hypothetical protein